jgi:Family of unknown function (DUF6502)
LNLQKVDQRLEDSLVHLLLPITRLLVRGGIGLDELMHAGKRAYLREAARAVAGQDGRTSISRLSVATGMTRKEVSALLRDSQHDISGTRKRTGQQRASRVLKGWLSDPRFQDPRGRPSELKYRAKRCSFSLLVKLYGGDVTPKSVLRELQRIAAVDLTSAGTVRLRTSRRRRAIEAKCELLDLAKMFEDFAFSVTKSDLRPESAPFFRSRDLIAPSTREAAYFMSKYSRRASALLEDFQRSANRRAAAKAGSRHARSARRVALGIYLLQTDSALNRGATGKIGEPATVRQTRTPSDRSGR